MARNAELNPKPAVKRPDTTSRRVEAIPAQATHTHAPNFPGEPGNPGDSIHVGQSPTAPHGWFHP